MKKILRFFDKLEDRVRGGLSRAPIVYGLIGGVGVVLFWRGVWHTADLFVPYFITGPDSNWYPKNPIEIWDGPVTLILSIFILLLTGLFVSSFIGNEIIISGLRRGKKIADKTEDEIELESMELTHIKDDLEAIKKEIEVLRQKLDAGLFSFPKAKKNGYRD